MPLFTCCARYASCSAFSISQGSSFVPLPWVKATAVPSQVSTVSPSALALTGTAIHTSAARASRASLIFMLHAFVLFFITLMPFYILQNFTYFPTLCRCKIQFCFYTIRIIYYTKKAKAPSIFSIRFVSYFYKILLNKCAHRKIEQAGSSYTQKE